MVVSNYLVDRCIGWSAREIGANNSGLEGRNERRERERERNERERSSDDRTHNARASGNR